MTHILHAIAAFFISLMVVILPHSAHFGSTVTTINGSDTLSNSRPVINTNFANLNTDKLENGSTVAHLIITTASSSYITSSNGATFGAAFQATFSSTGVLTLPTPLAIVSGGTGAATFTSGQVVYGNGTNGLTSVATTSVTTSAGLTTSGTAGALVGGSSLTLKQIENRSFSYATTTAWTGTTTIPLGVGYNDVWNTIKCFTDVGTLNVHFGYYTASTTMFNASTTIGTVAATPNNTMTAGNKVYVAIGTPVSSPTSISCTVNDTI